MTDIVDEFLAHNGVKGMHWGVVHKPESTGRIKRTPEMKTEARQAKRETKAHPYDERANKAQTAIDAINSQTHSRIGQVRANHQIKDLQKIKDQAVADAEAKRQGKLSHNQKKVVIGAAVAAAVLATAVVYNGTQSGEFNRLAMKGQAAIHGKSGINFKESTLLSNKNMSPDIVHKLVVKEVNPGYGAIGTRVNCRRCTFAYEMRRRGYDVRATGTTNSAGQTATGLANALRPGEKNYGTGRFGIASVMIKEGFVKDLHPDKVVNTPITDMMSTFAAGAKKSVPNPGAASILEHLAKEPNGSRGELGVMWKAGGGHSMAYEIFNGKPVIFDTQTGHKLGTLDELVAHGLDKVASAGTTRLDNVPLNHEWLARWVKNVK